NQCLLGKDRGIGQGGSFLQGCVRQPGEWRGRIVVRIDDVGTAQLVLGARGLRRTAGEVFGQAQRIAPGIGGERGERGPAQQQRAQQYVTWKCEGFASWRRQQRYDRQQQAEAGEVVAVLVDQLQRQDGAGKQLAA